MARTIGVHERNVSTLRRFNEAACLVRVRDDGPLTVSELARICGLSRPTVEAVMQSLLSAGVVEQDEPTVLEGKSAGRPARRYRFRGAAGHVAGVEVAQNCIRIVIADLAGVVGVRRSFPLTERGAELISVLRAAMDDCAGDLGLRRGDLHAAGIGFPGSVSSDGRLVTSAALPEWVGVDLVARLGAATGCPVVVDSAVNCALVAEHQIGVARLHDDVVLVTGSADISAAILLQGRLHRGRFSRAGDLSGSQPVEGVASLIRAVDPELVVLANPLADLPVEDTGDRTPPKIVTSSLGEDAVALGGLINAYPIAMQATVGSPDSPVPAIIFAEAPTPVRRSQPEAPSPVRNRPATRLRFGVVGIGARAGIATWAHDDRIGKVVAVADPRRETDERARTLFGPKVGVFADHRDLLDQGLDAVFVTSPDATHAQVSQTFLRAGVPVYLEKPLATTTEDADAILSTAYETGTKIYVGHNVRHMAFVRLMRQIIERGEIGEVKAIWCRHFVGHGGDFYFKDWHAERDNVNGLLVHKGAHDIDIMHWLAGGYTTEVVGMGDLRMYGELDARRTERHPQDLNDDLATWPPRAQRGLNPVIDVEDISMISMRLDNGVLCSYEQCHFTPDYWRNYTVIGTEGRLENFGDGDGGVVRVWNRRHAYSADGDLVYRISGDARGHDDADQLTVWEFLDFITGDVATDTTPLGARQAVCTGIEATQSLRSGALPRTVPPLSPEIVAYFENHQRVAP
ncbi:ROK family protein [Nonomuraea sp. NPDC003754]